MIIPSPTNWLRRLCERTPGKVSTLASAALLSSALVSNAQTIPQALNQPGYHRVGPIGPVKMGEFPEWYQDKTGLALEFGTPLTPTELAGGWVLLLPTDTIAPETYQFPRAVPSTFFDEHFYWHAAVTDKAVPVPLTVDPSGFTGVLYEMGLEAAFSTGVTEDPGSQIVFTRSRLFLRQAPFTGTYTLETPYKTYVYENVQAGDRLFSTEDFGVAAAPEGFNNVLQSPIGPFLRAADAPGGNELPPVTFEGRQYLADPATLTGDFVTGSPIGRNLVRLTGPNGFLWETNRFAITGRIKTGKVSSNIKLDRVSKFDAPGDQRIDAFGSMGPTLQLRMVGQPYVPATSPTLTLYPAPAVVDPVTKQLSAPVGVTGQTMLNNGPLGRSIYLQYAINPIPTAVTAVDDSGFVTQVPVTDTVVVTEADYNPLSKILTVSAATANILSPSSFYLGGIDGITTNTTFTSSIQIPNLSAPPSTVTVYSTHGGASTVSVTVGVPASANNNPPVAVDDAAGTLGATPVLIPVLANDTDPDKDRLTIDSVVQPTGGVVTIGDFNTTLTFTANAGVRGLVTFTYTVTDRRGGFSTANVVVNVDGAPLAANDTALATTGVAKVISVLANDSDPDNDPLTVTAVTTPTFGAVALGTTQITGGGTSVTYTPNVGTTGIHTFSYTITDGRGGFSTANVAVTVNTPPVANADSVFDVDLATIQIPVLSNDTDIDGDVITITAVSPTPRAIIEILNGTTLTFQPLGNVLPVETFTYTVSDNRGGQATGTVTVTQNRSPVANADSLFALAGTQVTLNVLANDTDPDGAADLANLTITGISQPTGAIASIAPGSKAVLFTFPANATTGTSFTYSITDGRGGVSTATVTVALNHAPVTIAGTAAAQAGTPITLTVIGGATPLVTDADGDVLTIQSVTANNGATAVINADNTITFTASAAVVASPQTLSYTVSDGRGALSTGVITITVNNAPIAVADSVSTSSGTSVLVSVLNNDTDPNGDVLTVSAISAQSGNGIATISTGNRTVLFTPTTGFTGTTTFQYRVSDNRGGTAVGTVTVLVTGIANRAPTLNVASIPASAVAPGNGLNGTPVVINVLDPAFVTDLDGDTLTVTAITQPAAGGGTVAISNAGRTVTYTPVFGASSAVQQFTCTISDGRGGTVVATIRVTVNDTVTVTQADYTVARSSWTLAGTAGANAIVTFTVKDAAGNTLTTAVPFATVTADARGNWKAAPTLTVPTTAATFVATSNQRGTGSRVIARK